MSVSASDVAQSLMRMYNMELNHRLASFTFLLYDTLTSLDAEVAFVWRSPNGLPKYLYFIARYVGLLGALLFLVTGVPVYCNGYIILDFVYLLVLVTSVEVSLMLRVDALYGKSRTIRTVLGVAFVLGMTVMVACNMAIYPTISKGQIPFPPYVPVQGCILPASPPLWKLSWVPVLVFETLLFALSTVKCISYGPLDHVPLIYRLFRDGTAYYAIIFVFVLVVCIAEFVIPAVSPVLVIWISATFSYAGCHLLLSLRKTGARRRRLHTNMLSANMPRFAFDTGLGASDSTTESEPELESPYPLASHRARLSIGGPGRRCGESVELVPRRVSLLRLSFGDRERDADADTYGDSGWVDHGHVYGHDRDEEEWDLGSREGVDWPPDGTRLGLRLGVLEAERGRASDESSGIGWLRRWKP